MALTQEYFSLWKAYKEKYGDKTLLFMQVGSFIEVYSKTSDDEDMVEFTTLCDLKIANKPLGSNKIYMAGFRDYMIDKYIQKMISQSKYTIVYYEQYEENGKICRNEKGIFSPGTLFQPSECLSNNITCIWIHKTTKLFSEYYIFGMTTLDTLSGNIYTYEHKVPYYHNPTTYDEIEKHISVYNPIELIVIFSIEKSNVNDILHYMNHKSKKITLIDLNENNFFSDQASKCEYQNYQESLMARYYASFDSENIKENLFHSIIAFQSLCFLLHFVEQHNPRLIQKIKEPIVEKTNKRLILANHSLKQLNILETDQSIEHKHSCILSLLNECKTKMGKRAFKHIMVNPCRDKIVLQESYDMTEHMIKYDYEWGSYFSKMKDIEYIHRKKVLKKATPQDYFYLYDFCIQLNHIIENLDDILLKYIDSRKTFDYMNNLKSKIENFFNVSIIQTINSCSFEKYPEIVDIFILRGNDETLDLYIKKRIESNDKLQSFIQYLEETYKLLDKKNKTNVIKIHETGSSFSLHITKRRGNILLKHLEHKVLELSYFSKFSNEPCFFQVDPISKTEYNSTTYCLGGTFLDEITHQINNESNVFYKQVHKVYESFDVDDEQLQHLIEVVQTLDILHCKKDIALKNNYCKPILEERDKSFLNIKELRHPLIEKIETQELYVTNDVSIGDDVPGILLFGTNAVGKTSFIKSIGIAVLMAQCGLYVPCKEMVYCPYEYIFTRIIGNDNIFKGLSTFGVEMSELRVILKYNNKNSLILGDELCSGTEIDSALSIFVSGLEKMYENNSSFIFATHFHQIQYYDEIKKMDKIQLKHLTVIYDHSCDKLIYNRKLQEGVGESIYGLEVCKSLSLPDDFLERAYDIRNKYDKSYNNILTYKTSRYNKDKLRGLCEFCNIEMSQEVHHLKYQSKFKDTQLHHKANLMCVCEKCHDKIHSLGLTYERKKTLDGSYKIILISKN
jgi:DNA mismatch repair protein MutS